MSMREIANTLVRRISSSHSTKLNSSAFETKSTFNTVIQDAERAVGYPTSFLSLRWILNDEIANVAIHIRKLLGTNHPLLKIARSLLVQNERATWGLIVLLVSKTAGRNQKFSELECDKTADILHSQRIIAEVTEMIKTSHLLHRGLINITSHENADALNFGNNLAILCGDYLLSTSFHEVAKLDNFEVQEKISSSLRDFAESEYIGLRDRQNQPVPTEPLKVQKHVDIPFEFGVEPFKIKNIMGNMRSEWILRNILGGANLLGKCCQCSLILANHERKVQELGYIFGRTFALASQASLEKHLLNDEGFSLTSAPVMFHLEYDPSLYKEIVKSISHEDVNYDFIKRTVLSGPGLQKTKDLKNEYSQAALTILDQFANSDSKTALKNIIEAL